MSFESIPWILYIILPLLGFILGLIFHFLLYRTKINKARSEADKIVRVAQKEAESSRKSAVLDAKEKFYAAKAEFEKQTKERRAELQVLEKRFMKREENLEKKLNLLDQKEQKLSKKKKDLERREASIDELENKFRETIVEQQRKLEMISGLSSEEAKEILIASMEAKAKKEGSIKVKKILDECKEHADQKSKEIIISALQRCASEHVVESTVTVVDLPSEEMKGRIIGREGRNIRALETATGIDLIIDDTPEAVILSGFDPIRREVAAITLKRLINDGRIHPARIEEVVKKVQDEMAKSLKELGEQTVFELGLANIHPEIINLIGRLKYRTSYAQNVLQHSKEVAFLASMMADSLGINRMVARRAGLLHDIGKAVDHEYEGTHAQIGADLAKRYGEADPIVDAIMKHHDEEPQSIEAVLIQAADALSAARPGARREILETYIKRLEKLEAIADSFKGVQKAYAIQAGREIRIIVEPTEISDSEMCVLSRDIAEKIEQELEYPGEIKVTAIRETRTVDYAK
ncbi:ribonuclease Y [bacterium]|nr:ribonuclease Y [bacterium]